MISELVDSHGPLCAKSMGMLCSCSHKKACCDRCSWDSDIVEHHTMLCCYWVVFLINL